MLAGALNVCEAPFDKLAALTVTTKPPLLPEMSLLEASIWPSVIGLKLEPLPTAFAYLLPGTVAFVSSLKLPATRTSHKPLLQYALKPPLLAELPVPPSAGQKALSRS